LSQEQRRKKKKRIARNQASSRPWHDADPQTKFRDWLNPSRPGCVCPLDPDEALDQRGRRRRTDEQAGGTPARLAGRKASITSRAAESFAVRTIEVILSVNELCRRYGRSDDRRPARWLTTRKGRGFVDGVRPPAHAPSSGGHSSSAPRERYVVAGRVFRLAEQASNPSFGLQLRDSGLPDYRSGCRRTR